MSKKQNSDTTKPVVMPRFIKKTEAIKILGSATILKRMLHASKPHSKDPWLKILPGAVGKIQPPVYIEYQSLVKACDRLLKEQPPLFPAEIKLAEYLKNKNAAKKSGSPSDQPQCFTLIGEEASNHAA